MNQSESSSTHVKPFLACAALIVFALAYSWAVPFVHVRCTRDGDRIECVVRQRLLGLIPYKSATIDDLESATFTMHEGDFGPGQTSTTDTGYLVLRDANGNETTVMLESMEELGMTRGKTFVEGIETFLTSDQPEFSSWTVPLLGYGALIPAALGLLFLSLVGWDFVSTRLQSGGRKPGSDPEA